MCVIYHGVFSGRSKGEERAVLGGSERKRSGNIEGDLINGVNQVETGNGTILTIPCA